MGLDSRPSAPGRRTAPALLLALVAAWGGALVAAPPPPAAPEAVAIVKPVPQVPHATQSLSLGTLAVLIDQGRRGAIHAPESRVQAVITLSSPAQRGAEASITAEADGATILSATVKGGRVEEAGPRWTARLVVDGAQPAVLTIDMRAKPPAEPDDRNATASLRLTLRSAQAGDQPTEVVLTWPVLDCAGSFRRDLALTNRALLSPLPDALRSVRTANPALSGRWIFADPREMLETGRANGVRPGPEPAPERGEAEAPFETVEERVCTSRTDNGACSSWTTRVHKRSALDLLAAAAPNDAADKLERAVLMLADRLIRARGAQPEFVASGRFGWIATRISADLKAFVEQAENPALCTGAIELVDYFEGNLSALRKHASSMAEATRVARALAASRVRELAREVRPTRGEPVQSAQPGSRPLAALIGDLAGELIGEADARALAALPSVLEALARLEQQLAARRLDQGDASQRAALGALRLIEAAAHIESAERRIDVIATGLLGSLAAIREAHSRSCVCVR